MLVGAMRRRYAGRHADVGRRHEPLDQQALRCIVGRDYPGPIVDHRAARERALAAYREKRKETTT